MLAASGTDALLKAGGALLAAVSVVQVIRGVRRTPEGQRLPWWAWLANGLALALVGLGNIGVLRTWLLLAAVGFGLVGAYSLGALIAAEPSRLFVWRRRLPGALSKLERGVLTRALEEEGDRFSLMVPAIYESLDQSHLGDRPTPYLGFTFSMHNGSLFPVEVQAGNATGYVVVKGKPLSRLVTVTCDHSLLEHAWYGQLQIRQTLSHEEADWLRDITNTGERALIGFHEVEVPLRRVFDGRAATLILNEGHSIRADW